MAIRSNEMKFEIKKFQNVKTWIEDKVDDLTIKNEECKERISNLKKASGGTYSTDLILCEQRFKFISRNLHEFNESKNIPYFSRIDFKEKYNEKESFYIGKFGLNDDLKNEEVIIDWRAPLANLYYSGTYGKCSYNSPAGKVEGELELKRKFLIRDGALVDAFDEGINEIILKSNAEGDELVDEFLKVTLDQNVSSKLKDVVATIQKEQNEIIRAYKNKPIIIQGSAGSGKTTVALHRLAYLVYQYEEEVKDKDILVVAPNKIFLDYISEILPNLGVYNIKQNTFDGICKEFIGYKGKILNKDEKLAYLIEAVNEEECKYIKAISKIKGSLTYKTLIDKYVMYLEKQDINLDDIKVGKYTLYSQNEIKRLYVRDLIHLPIKKRKEEIERYFKKQLHNRIDKLKDEIEKDYFFMIKDIKSLEIDELEKRKKIIELYDERDREISMLKRNSSEVLKEFFKQWKSRNVIELYNELYSSKEFFNNITNNKLPSKIVNYIVESSKNNIDNKVIDSEDLCHILYLKMKIEGIDKNFIHIIVDEAQDYSMFEMHIIKLLSTQNSVTIVGDLGQGIYNYKGIDNWKKVISSVYNDDTTYINLTQSYRSTVEIIDFANEVLKEQKLDIIPAKPVLRHGDKPKILKFKSNEDFIRKVEEIINEIDVENKTTIAIICKTLSECKEIFKYAKKMNKQWECISNSTSKIKGKRIIIPSYMTKGLEFDTTIIYNCSENNYSITSELDKKILYVNLTRALHKEFIFFNGELSKMLTS